MTLKEKFESVEILVYSDFGDHNRNMEEKEIEDCAKIAEDFAIGFAVWIAKEYWLNSSEKYTQGQTNEELLEIYKEEKGL